MNIRATGPVPLRTARGAGRTADLRATGRLAGRLEALVLADFVGALLGDFRARLDRVLEPLRPLLLDLEEDVLLLRDPGGEDVRVAIRPK